MDKFTSMLKPHLTLKKAQDTSKKELNTLKKLLTNQDHLQPKKTQVLLIFRAEPIIITLDNLLHKYITHMEASLI
jgi:hypothetical protein